MIRESTDAERRARQYLDGYLVAAIMGVTAPRVKKYLDTWPPGLWIDVHLTGDDLVKYLPDGTRYVVSQPSGRTRMRRAVAALRGWARNLDH